MSTQKPASLVEEIIENARADRGRLVAVADGLKKFAERGRAEAEGDGEGMDPEVALALSEQVAKVSDSLTKINQQLVELVKIDARRVGEEAVARGPGKMSAKEKERAFEEIERAANAPSA